MVERLTIFTLACYLSVLFLVVRSVLLDVMWCDVWLSVCAGGPGPLGPIGVPGPRGPPGPQ